MVDKIDRPGANTAQIPGRSIHPLVRDPVGFWGFDMLLTDGSAVQLDLPGFHMVVPQ